MLDVKRKYRTKKWVLKVVFIYFIYLVIDLVSRSRPGSRLSAAASRNNSRNGSPEIRRLVRDDGVGGGGGGGGGGGAGAGGGAEVGGEGEVGGSHLRPFRVRAQLDDMRDYAELVDEEGDYSTPSGKAEQNKTETMKRCF